MPPTLKEFIDNDKIIDFERRSNEAYTDLIHRIGKETTDMLSKEGLIRKTISDINSDLWNATLPELSRV